MADITYTTMAALSETDAGGWPRVFNKPADNMVERTPNLGYKFPFFNDIKWTVRDTGYISDAGAIAFSGTNGLEHFQSYRFGNAGSIFPKGDVITGFQLENTQNSTAGHGMYLSRMGLIFRNKSGNELFWGSNVRGRPNTFNKQTWRQEITQEERNQLNGYLVDSLAIEISTSGGSGTRTSEVTLGGFKLLYNVGPSNMRWVAGAMRKRDQAFGEGSIQFI